ncbi:Creatinine amidohydrolase [Jeotgalicoccus saudimassiliensis]|uniref:Creatinine amidohydrolase n=1 Tax=Jeotgalicoccus saudimassiliensis TaxID=1461582 RepID=A0A078M6E8_9STAP|nr:creatininase family protein [Jeotgalicoccus saudimassiliensis]CEA03013.1 Creatinine amidohydrolase [Jeotgalicoccus saudimassiliensis]
MNSYILSDMTWPEIESAFKDVKIAIIPVGAQEQHGHHIAEGCDSYRAGEFSKLLTERNYPSVALAPTINYGVSPHHMNFPGTISLKPETLIALLDDIVTSLSQHGIEKFLVINGHGGNTSTLNVAAEKIARDKNVSIAVSKYVDAASDVIQENITSEHFGHACEREVSESLYLYPSIVRKDKLQAAEYNDSFALNVRKRKYIKLVHQFDDVTKNGNLGDGRKGSYELGEKIINQALENLTGFIKEFIEE